MPSSKKKPVRRTSNSKKKSLRKKPKVQLKNSSVIALSLVLVFLCSLLLMMNFLMAKDESSSEKNTAKNKQLTQTEKTVKENLSLPKKAETPLKEVTVKEEKPSLKNQGLENKTSSVQKKTESKASAVEVKKPLPDIKVQEKIASVVKPQGPKPLPPKFKIPEASKNAILVFVIDDAGLSLEKTKKYTDLPFAITIAVLPKLKHSKDCAYLVRSSKKELILHQPMQSLNLNLNPGPGAITSDMGTYEIVRVIKENLEELGPGVKGMNNHEGSLITSDKIKIGAVLEVCMEKGIYFLDSRTTSDTQAPQAALERDISIFEKNAPYIDNIVSRDAMLKEIYACLDVANKKGKAIMIGHVDKSAEILPALLRELYPYLVEKGYKFATPSMLR